MEFEGKVVNMLQSNRRVHDARAQEADAPEELPHSFCSVCGAICTPQCLTVRSIVNNLWRGKKIADKTPDDK
jgi:hypothetical protein